MQATVLFGSPHKHGATAAATAAFLRTLPADAHITLYDAYALAAKPCLGCGACKTGRCVYGDLDGLFAACAACDLLVLATPVYNYSVPAPLKAILDRAQPFYYKNFRGLRAQTDPARRGYLILTAGRGGQYAFDLIRKQADVFFRCFDITYAGRELHPFTDKKETQTT